MAKHIKEECIDTLAEQYATGKMNYVEAFFAYKAGFEKAMEQMGRRPRTKTVNGVKYKLRTKKT